MCVYEVCMYWILTPSTVLPTRSLPHNLIQPLMPSHISPNVPKVCKRVEGVMFVCMYVCVCESMWLHTRGETKEKPISSWRLFLIFPPPVCPFCPRWNASPKNEKDAKKIKVWWMECSRLFEHRPLSQFVYDHDMKPREKVLAQPRKNKNSAGLG